MKIELTSYFHDLRNRTILAKVGDTLSKSQERKLACFRGCCCGGYRPTIDSGVQLYRNDRDRLVVVKN